MGRPESSSTGRPRWRGTAVAATLVGALLLCAAGYFGGPVRMMPGRDGTAPEPVLMLRSVYVQSTPKPPSALVALSVQGTAAGRAALRGWYDDQAALARERGYSFPFRIARWTRPRDPGALGRALAHGAAALFGGAAASPSDAQLAAQHTLAFAAREPTAAAAQISAGAAGAGGAGAVTARGTSRMLHRMREQYLRSAHGQRHSYWAAAPTRAQSANTTTGRWDYFIDDGLVVPNVTHKATMVHLARMAANAYQPVGSDTWESLGDRWDTHDSFGWAADGVRGHVFADATNETVVISLKGTSSTFFLGGGSETSARDKFNDNRLFSCCCAYVDFTWSTVCDCHMSGFKCNATCLQTELNDEAADNYFFAAAQIFMDVVERYPSADIILTGHSLGGALASLLGLTFGLPAIAFEAPGDKLPARRLHLPMPPAETMDRLPLFHIGNTADPVFMGVCSGRTSSCYYAGYALESQCHNGRRMVFDTVARRGWRTDIRHHRINEVIYLVFEPWGNNDPDEAFPVLEPGDRECVDCGLWKFVDEDTPQ
ncbi:putative lipase atg15 [Coemansia javaensis]|uniref:triacylglycerol lipase n=1 Tax=Coemansia javaensis TaxID=2761396 RepID=A0A9W8HG78_9FUNG|nr:putative lipase atg15 [Coemansia javaensis]